MESKFSHDIEPVAQDCENNEQFGSRDRRDIENQLPDSVLILNGMKVNYENVCEILWRAAVEDNWKLAEQILNKDPSFVRQTISDQLGTILHIAATTKSTRFVRELMKLIEVSELEVKNKYGNTAFSLAAGSGFIEIVKAMRGKNENLPNIRGYQERLPITTAAMNGYKAMVSYLFEVTKFDVIQQQERLDLLRLTTQNEMYDVALYILKKDRKLASKTLQESVSVLHILSGKSLVISNREENLKRFIEGGYSPVWRKFISLIFMARSQFITLLKLLQTSGVLPERYVPEKQAGLLLEELLAECKRSAKDKLSDVLINEGLIRWAAIAGNVEFLVLVIHSYPDLIDYLDQKGRTIFHLAVLLREEKILSLIHQIGGMKNFLLPRYDIDGNNIIHLAGRLGVTNYFDKDKIMPPSFLKVSGAALQMQREIMWFKEVEKLLPPSHHQMRNKAGKTPRELFTEEHKLLLKEGERWMKDTANSCMIVATLIATMVFAAGFTVPGGNNGNNGIPVLLKFNGFVVFVISDAVALFSSIISIIMFLSILTSRYAEDDFLVSLPAKLFFGLTALFVSIVSMLLAFTATFFLVYSNHTGWEPKLIAACAGIPVALFGCLQYKLWFDVAKSTYSSRFFLRPGKHKLF
ncbi:ankyrin repeat-containing protein ITN1-like [Solanum stenotomum]|uniref:ankyrin repeat-containing protein ITN1-like n=1 Tax=Solanum stenotomum TaxID=172797 RepID=UPI0020D168EC|nr:ankyrin repeat-containing protein ITN1-like [Solanum stenotomum]